MYGIVVFYGHGSDNESMNNNISWSFLRISHTTFSNHQGFSDVPLFRYFPHYTLKNLKKNPYYKIDYSTKKIVLKRDSGVIKIA